MQHASMLVFYGLMIVTFILTLKAAYHNLFKLYQWHQKQSTCNCVCRALFCCCPVVIDENEGHGTMGHRATNYSFTFMNTSLTEIIYLYIVFFAGINLVNIYVP